MKILVRREPTIRLPQKNLKNCLFRLYSETFVASNSTHNLIIDEVSNLHDAQNQAVPAASGSVIGDQTTWAIHLNRNNFPHALTQELWASIILHELVHGFIQKNNLDFSLNSSFSNVHKVMLNNWILEVRDALVEAFLMTPEDALSLSLDGFDDILRPEVPTQFTIDMQAWVEATYSVDLNEITHTADQYCDGTKGLKCL